jgi:orotate phosphoribosyltransferase
MTQPDKLLAKRLLQINAINLQPENPFVWASGWNSPIYTDNRKTLSYPDIRNLLKVELSRMLLENFSECEVVAGVATGAIALGALVADILGLPYVYVRSAPKDHGMENLIEGNLKPGSKVVVIEDLVSTGGSSLKAVEAIRNAGCEVLGMEAIFTYEFPVSVKRFRDANVNMIPVLKYSTMLDVAVASDYIRPEDVETLHEWRKDPANWAPKSMND